MKNFQKIYSIHLLGQNIFDKKMYLPSFMDNRGRQYQGTLLSPTFSKLYRYLYKFSVEKEDKNLENSVYYMQIMQYSNLVEEFNLSNYKIYVLLVFFLEVGKFFIKKTDNCFVLTENIIKLGIDNYERKNINLEFEDLLYVNKLYYGINNLINKNILDKNTIIFKDATASGLQNYGIILGYKDNMLQYLNIDGIN
jgi:hypothetical protein